MSISNVRPSFLNLILKKEKAVKSESETSILVISNLKIAILETPEQHISKSPTTLI